MKDFYYILGTEENCTTPEIKEAYRKLSKKFHPDLNFNDKYFEKHFREIKEAYETLIDPVKRSIYNQKLNKFKSDPSYNQYAEDLKFREEELKKREEKIRFRQAYPHYYRSRKASVNDEKGPVAPAKRSRIRKVDMAFTLILVAITIIFGNYVLRVVHDEKQVKIVSKPLVVADVPFQPVIHKRKHKIKAIWSLPSVAVTNTKKPKDKIIADDYKSAVAETKAEENKPAEKVPVIDDNKATAPGNSDDQPVQNVIVNYKTAASKNNFLYATNIVSNVTGVTNMRKTDRYGSPIIKEIPTNSKVLVIQKGDVFYKVLCDNFTGYVPKWSLETK